MLSPREKQVIKLYVERGWKVREVAKALNITPGTAKHYLSSAYKRLGIDGRQHSPRVRLAYLYFSQPILFT